MFCNPDDFPENLNYIQEPNTRKIWRKQTTEGRGGGNRRRNRNILNQRAESTSLCTDGLFLVHV